MQDYFLNNITVATLMVLILSLIIINHLLSRNVGIIGEIRKWKKITSKLEKQSHVLSIMINDKSYPEEKRLELLNIQNKLKIVIEYTYKQYDMYVKVNS